MTEGSCILQEDVKLIRPKQNPKINKEDEGKQRRDYVERVLNIVFVSLAKKNHMKEPSLLVFILPNRKNKDPATCSDIKWWADCIKGVPSTCISDDCVWKYQDGRVLGDLALKINYKLGGTNHCLKGDAAWD
ncbi:hypothetical protein OCU04_008536 [Sclerotinia nivalis]|uniref:Uncharacterized protein n=1 Tax=Sclerotinia nivalis TaxID=352851 RepID=A0A9X0AI92_9HELO|nr:hypothetical protein OCU04_008536 [Sclerotinia nivalis]